MKLISLSRFPLHVPWVLLALLASMTASAQQDIKSLYPLMVFNKKKHGKIFLMISGDGGSNAANKSIATELSKEGATVLLLDSKKYFWHRKDPNDFAADVQKILSHYMNILDKKSCTIVGYSFGADVAAYLPARLNNETKKKLTATILLSPSQSTDFEIRLADMISVTAKKKRQYDVLKEITHSATQIVCVVGNKDRQKDSLILTGAKVLVMKGGHDFNGDFNNLANALSPFFNF